MDLSEMIEMDASLKIDTKAECLLAQALLSLYFGVW